MYLCYQDFEVPPAEHVPRVLPKNEDPSLVSQSKRMLGQVLGTLEVHQLVILFLNIQAGFVIFQMDDSAFPL